MEAWSVHHLFDKASENLGSKTASELQQYASRLIHSGIPVIFSLGHLAKIVGADYQFLHDTVNRKRDAANYRMFAIHKRSGGRRFIHAVSGSLLSFQQFLNNDILQKIRPHTCSFAFHSDGGIRNCASRHCGARWLFQFDLADFFYSISEIRAYHVFKKLGYKNLLAFEFARLCTTTHLPKSVVRKLTSKYWNYEIIEFEEGETKLPYMNIRNPIGVLPQGAPTSPMISNLAAFSLDEKLHHYALSNGFVYTRYADDLTFSANLLPKAKSVRKIQREIIDLIRKSGYVENLKKIRIAGPGSKKIVLGLLVDGERPRISKEVYKRIDRHLYATEKFGLGETAEHEGFDSAYGFYNHLLGLLSYVKDVDRTRWKTFNERFQKIASPL